MGSPDRRQQFIELISQHQPRILGYLCAMVPNRDDALDLNQQTLSILWRKFDNFDEGTNFVAWALRIAELEVRNFRRRRSDTVALSEEALTHVAEAIHEKAQRNDSDARQAALTHCLDKLGEGDRSLVEQVYLENGRINQVADNLGRLPQSVSNSLRRIRHTLFNCIEERTQEGSGE